MSGAMGMMLYDNAQRAVAQLAAVDEVAEHLDKAAAVEEYARRAGDRTMEVRAAEYRTYCERRLGEFSAAAVRPGPGQPEKNAQDRAHTSRRDVAGTAGVGESHLRYTSEPLAAASDDAVAAAVEEVKQDGNVPTPAKVVNKLSPLMSSDSDEWYTPEHVWRAALAAMRLEEFDVDPCAEPVMAVAAAKHYTQSDDGLSQPWHGVAWVNPPYSEIGAWVDYLIGETLADRCKDFAALVPARVDTKWWRALTAGEAGSVVFISGRLKFGGSANSAPFPSALVFGCTDPDDVASVCINLGRTWRPMA